MFELDRNLYTVAWIAPLYIEAKAALLMLDKKHRGHFKVSRGDDYVYHAGSIGGHNVVVATLPAGQEYGTGSAAALAGQLRKTFPNLWFGLLVGVAAGLPDLSRKSPRDIRLGDVLVALPDGDTPALVAYDLGKDTGAHGFQPLSLGHVLAHTETIVRSAIGKIKLAAPNDAEAFLPYYEDIMEVDHGDGNFKDPGQENDRLYDFDQYGEQYEVIRPSRSDDRRTRVWYGPIGSGEKLMKNGRQRNELRDRYNIIGLEMEAAGTMNRIPVGVIRGVCDYADEHKNKEWQPYAAAMAAAYAKAVLREILPDGQDSLSFVDSESTAIIATDNIQQNHFLSKFFESSASETSKMSKKRQMEDEDLSTQTPSSTSSGSFYRRMKGFQKSAGGVSRTLHDISPSLCIQTEKPSEQWPQFQTERPGLSAKYLQREDTPHELLDDSDAWKTLSRRIPWTLVVYGLSGVGKSQMCLKAVIEHERSFRGVFYVDASNAATADSNFVDISRVCNIQHHWEGIRLEEQIRITRAWLACQKDPWILMIDNADSTELHLQKYIPTGGAGTVLITTTDERYAMCGHNFCKISSMEDYEAFHLLMQYKRPEATFDSTEERAAKTLAIQVLGGLPLAIAQAGSYIFNHHYTYTEYLEEFRMSPQISLGANLQSEQWASRHQPIWTTFALSLHRIQEMTEEGSAEAVDLFKTLCFFHHEGLHVRIFKEAWENMQDFPSLAKLLPPIVRLSDRWDTRNFRAALNILCRYSLLNPTSSSKGQYSMHSILQTICINLMSSGEQTLHFFYAASLIGTALSGIKTPFSWIENPSGYDLQRFMLPHIKACISDRISSLLPRAHGNVLSVGLQVLLLFAKANSATGHFQDARSLVQQSLHVLDTYRIPQTHGWIRGTRMRLLEQRATCEAQLGRHAEALELRQQILATEQSIQAEYISDNHCVAMMNVSDSLWALGKRKLALEMAEACLRIREVSLEPRHPKIHRTKRKIAEFLHGLDERQRALILRETVYHEANWKSRQSSANTVIDMEKLDFIASTSALSDSYQWDGQLLEARKLRQEVYDLRNDILGPEHPEILLAHDKLLVTKRYCTRDTQEQQRICQLWKKSVVIWRRTVGDLHPYTLEARANLGLQHCVLHEFTAALSEQEDVLNIRRRQFEAQSNLETLSTYLSSIANVSSLFVKIKQSNNALNLRKAALDAARDTCDPNDAFIAKAHNSLLNCEADLRQRDPKGVLIERRRILKAQKSSLPEQSPIVLKTLSYMATDYEKLGKRTKAINIRRQLQVDQRSSLGSHNRETIDNLKKLALILARKGRRNPSFYSEAIPLLSDVEAVQKRHLGAFHLQTLATISQRERICSHAYRRGILSENELEGSENVFRKSTTNLLEAMEGKKTKQRMAVSTKLASSDSSDFCSSSMAETAADDITSEDISDVQSSVSSHHDDSRGIHNSEPKVFGPRNVASSHLEYQRESPSYSRRRWIYSRRRYRYNKSPSEASFGESGSEASVG